MILDKAIGVNFFRGSRHFRVTGHQRLLKRAVLPKIALFGPVLQPLLAGLAKRSHKIPYFGGCTCTKHHACVCMSQTLCCTVSDPTTGSVGGHHREIQCKMSIFQPNLLKMTAKVPQNGHFWCKITFVQSLLACNSIMTASTKKGLNYCFVQNHEHF